jgi:hypothetical protein
MQMMYRRKAKPRQSSAVLDPIQAAYAGSVLHSEDLAGCGREISGGRRAGRGFDHEVPGRPHLVLG